MFFFFLVFVFLQTKHLIFDLLHPTGQDLQSPRGKGHKRTSRSHLAVRQSSIVKPGAL